MQDFLRSRDGSDSNRTREVGRREEKEPWTVAAMGQGVSDFPLLRSD